MIPRLTVIPHHRRDDFMCSKCDHGIEFHNAILVDTRTITIGFCNECECGAFRYDGWNA